MVFSQGLPSVLAFAVAGIPFGVISDRMNRRNLLAGAVVVWSICTALGGLARNFVQLVLTRVGVGAAEASAAPIAMPMITDVFPARKRTFALGVFYMSPSLGTFLASVLGALHRGGIRLAGGVFHCRYSGPDSGRPAGDPRSKSPSGGRVMRLMRISSLLRKQRRRCVRWQDFFSDRQPFCA